MKENIVVAIFANESEAFQTLTELRQSPSGEGYTAVEGVLLKRQDDIATVLDGFDTGERTSDDTMIGMVIGSLVGVLGGPLGMLMGAGAGGVIGGTVDTVQMLDDASLLEIISTKLYNGEVAIVALVNEDEPAFDTAISKYDPIIVRFDVADVVYEVERAYELELELANEAAERLREERKAEWASFKEDGKAVFQKHFEELAARREARADSFDEAMGNASTIGMQ